MRKVILAGSSVEIAKSIGASSYREEEKLIRYYQYGKELAVQVKGQSEFYVEEIKQVSREERKEKLKKALEEIAEEVKKEREVAELEKMYEVEWTMAHEAEAVKALYLVS